MRPKISLITVAFNSKQTIRSTLESVSSQDYPDIEHIVIDGASTDGTVQVAREFNHVTQIVSEPDEGIYDAMNKGIAAATGDIVGILNADDFFAHSKVLTLVANEFKTPDVEATIGDVIYVDRENETRTRRYYSAKHWEPSRFAKGFMPPHASFYTWKRNFDRFGDYKLGYQIAADYELLVRFLGTHGLKYSYIPEPMVHMRLGGVSNASFRNHLRLNREVMRACSENGVNINMFNLTTKYFRKIFEYAPARFR